MRPLALIPNILSTARLGLAVWFPFAPQEHRLAILVAAAATDFADGFIARRYKVTSWIGGLLDALADKLFVACVLVTFTLGEQLLAWQAALLLTRDAAVLFIAAYAAATRKWYAFRLMPSRMAGKLTTAMMFLFFIVCAAWPNERTAITAAFAVTALLSAAAALDYLTVFARERREDKRGS